MMTQREAFDKVKSHLLTQNTKAKNIDGTCKYRTDDGLKCAVGCLISDHVYSPLIEGVTLGYEELVPTHRGWDSTNVGIFKIKALADALNDSGVPASTEMKSMLAELQDLHDLVGIDLWSLRLDTIESKYFGGAESVKP